MSDRADERGKAWWNDAREVLLAPLRRIAFERVFAACGRWVGQSEVELSEDEARAIAQADLRAPPHWKLDDFARAALLVEAIEAIPEEEQPALVRELYQRGDNRERQAVLQSLSLLPRPERHLDTAIEACRTNVRTVFEAIACTNPYPAEYFPTLNFNQMVLKALFMEVPLSGVEGLRLRITLELVRMARDYASERSAAGRTVPADIGLLTSEASS